MKDNALKTKYYLNKINTDNFVNYKFDWNKQLRKIEKKLDEILNIQD